MSKFTIFVSVFLCALAKIALFGKLWFAHRLVGLANVCNAGRQFVFLLSLSICTVFLAWHTTGWSLAQCF